MRQLHQAVSNQVRVRDYFHQVQNVLRVLIFKDLRLLSQCTAGLSQGDSKGFVMLHQPVVDYRCPAIFKHIIVQSVQLSFMCFGLPLAHHFRAKSGPRRSWATSAHTVLTV